MDSIPTSANQEDHVSMATHGARRLLSMAANSAAVVGIELLSAAQAIDFQAPLQTSPPLRKSHAWVRDRVAHYAEDRFFAPDIECVSQAVMQGEMLALSGLDLPST